MIAPPRSILASLAVSLFLIVAVRAQQPPPRSEVRSSQALDVLGGRIRIVTVATGLFHPWSLAFLPDGRLLIAERDGKLRIVGDGVLAPEVVWTSPTPRGQAADSLHGLAVHPQFAQNNLVYVSYPKTGPRGITLAVARGRLQGSTLT